MQNKPWETLKVSRATYYRLLKTQPHSCLIDDYIQFRRLGLQESPWSQNHERNCLYQLKAYLKLFPIVSYWGIASYLTGTYSQNKDRHTALSNFSRYLNHLGELSDEELYKIRKIGPKKSSYHIHKQRLLTREQVEYLSTLSDIIKFLSETALRISEFSSLTREDLKFSSNPSESIILVRQGKGGKSRVIPYTPKAKECQWEIGKSRYHWGKVITDISKETRIDFSAHSLRHYRITQWANNPRIPIATTQKWAGHNDLTTTQKYIHISDEEALRAAYGL